MSLSGDQKALLQLLVVRGKNPDEIASLLGIDRTDVESRIGQALEALAPGRTPIPREVSLFLVGQADPMTRADAAALLDEDETLSKRAETVRESLRREVPGEAQTDQPHARSERATQPETMGQSIVAEGIGGSDDSIGGPKGVVSGDSDGSRRMDAGQRRLLSILVSAVGLIAIVVAVVLILGGNGDDPEQVAGPTEARLAPVGGKSGAGSVEFGFSGNEFAANISVTGIGESAKGDSYALWLDGPVGAFPFERAKAGAQGVIAGQSSINQAIICFIAADLFTDVKLSRAPDARFRKALRDAVAVRGGGGPFPRYVGETILEGPISMPAETRETLVRECGGRVPAGGNQGS